MQRRKFVVGLGSLAAGASAAMGTGAITESSFNRDLTGQVVNDKEGYVQVLADGNGAPVEYHDGEVALDFDNFGTNNGKGLNADSINYIDNLIEVRVMPEDAGSHQWGSGKSNTAYYLWFTSPHGELKFYHDGNKSNSLMGAVNAKAMIPKDSSGNTISNSASPPKNVAYFRLIAGLCVDLESTNLEAGDSVDDWFSGEENFRIHVQQGDPTP